MSSYGATDGGVALRTVLCALLGIEAPVVQAPIGPGASAELAAAVSNAGGFGMLAGTFYQTDELRELIRATRALTGKPFGVNFIIAEEMHDLVEVCLESVSRRSRFSGEIPRRTLVGYTTPAQSSCTQSAVPPKRAAPLRVEPM
jgi:NAD(P)H-dependent flavin oxidoreductase YrpB (nitropropane dioxygenase family)